MRIYEMTATFGKLENATLTLCPGLNIIEAPNEWGKSTWCAFLLAMLYGLDTRAKTTKTALADKERYAPWSGAPMAGRVSLNWNGRDITIERRTKGRIPLGEFRAYETHSGLAVPELTAANCGQKLLGVEQSVFRRAGFIRLSDLPVTQDEALRSRLNALVTTGDESGDGEKLAKGLRELKNRCRYNRTGLIPQAEAERAALEEKLRELEELATRQKAAEKRLGELDAQLLELENHKAALAYAAYRENARRVEAARNAREEAAGQLRLWDAACKDTPSREEAEEKLQQLRTLQEQWRMLRQDAELLLQPSQETEPEPAFSGLDGQEAVEQARKDAVAYRAISGIKPLLPFLIPGALLLIAGAVLPVLTEYLYGGIGLGAGLLLLVIGLGRGLALRKRAKAIGEKYGSSDPSAWMAAARRYDERLQIHRREVLEHDTARQRLERRRAALTIKRRELCGDRSMEEAEAALRQNLENRNSRESARREFDRAEEYLQAISATARPVPAPTGLDELKYTESETAELTARIQLEQQRLLSRKAHCQGRMEALGRRELLEKQLQDVKERLQKLEDTYAALTIAQEALAQARMELQRRFAPRISHRAREWMEKLTAGRYDRLTLEEDFSILAGAGEETTLHEALWRSEGTVDQLYLALRLAVAEELTPDAPLVLDDALVRFDDTRLKAAMEILSQMSEKKQVILFTCQSREANYR